MLSKVFRLKKKKDFEKIARSGKTVNSDFLVLKVASNDIKETRVGFVCSKKISKKAITRNRIKRQLREVVKKNLPDLKQGYDIVLFSKTGILNKDFFEIKADAEKAFKKAKLYV